MTELQIAGKLLATERGDQQRQTLNEALKFFTFEELYQAVEEYKKSQAK